MLSADLLITEAWRLARLPVVDQDMIHSTNVLLLVARLDSLSISAKRRAAWSMSNLITQMQQSELRDLTSAIAKPFIALFNP